MNVPAPSSIAPPTVRVLAVTVRVGEAPRVTAPLPIFRLWVPVKVKLPFHDWALLFERVTAEPEVLLMVPPAMVKVLAPRAPAAPTFRLPELRVTPLAMVFVPFRFKVPVVTETPPEISLAPPRVRVPPVTATEPVMVLAPFMVAVPAVTLRPAPMVLPPFMVKSVPETVTEPPIELSVPPKVAVPSETSRLPPMVTLPPIASVPAPALVSERVLEASLIVPPTVRVPEDVVRVAFPASITAPAPRLRALLPVKVKLPFQLMAGLLPVRFTDEPSVLLMVAPGVIVKVPVPRAVLLLMLSVPALSVRPPAPLLPPLSVSAPPPVFTMRALMVRRPPTVREEPLAPVPSTDQVWLATLALEATSGALITIFPALASTEIPLEVLDGAIVSVPVEPWLRVTAVTPEGTALNCRPSMVKLLSSVVVIVVPLNGAEVALKITVSKVPGTAKASVVPAASVVQFATPEPRAFHELPPWPLRQ